MKLVFFLKKYSIRIKNARLWYRASSTRFSLLSLVVSWLRTQSFAYYCVLYLTKVVAAEMQMLDRKPEEPEIEAEAEE